MKLRSWQLISAKPESQKMFLLIILRLKNVNKPKGAKPGIVYYENHQSVYVTPNEEELKQILKRTAEQSN